MSSYIITHYPVPEPVYRRLDAELKRLNAAQRRFVLHVLVSNILNLQKMHRHNLAGWLDVAVELPYDEIADHFGSRFRARDIDPAILTIAPYSTALHRCQSFAVSNSLMDIMLTWSSASTQEASTVLVVDLFDGKPYRRPVLAQWEHGVYTSPLIRRAISCFGDCPFDGSALDDHLAEFEERIRSAAPADREPLEAAYGVDCGCAGRIRAGCLSGAAAGMFFYRPEYRTSGTGRITEIGGGAQSCSKAMKAALFGAVPDLHNYDLSAAQMNILLQELEDAALPRDWVEEFLAKPHAAQSRADAIGISKECFKKCLYATIMGATLHNFPDPKKNDVYAALLRECDKDESRAKRLLPIINRALDGLKNEVQPWREHLLAAPGCRRLDTACRKVRTLQNACGQHFKMENYPAGKLGRKAVAFILQGQEAAFIHHLTQLGKTHGFTPISNQHDGLCTIGTVPPQATEIARSASALRYGTLEEKPFVAGHEVRRHCSGTGGRHDE